MTYTLKQAGIAVTKLVRTYCKRYRRYAVANYPNIFLRSFLRVVRQSLFPDAEKYTYVFILATKPHQFLSMFSTFSHVYTAAQLIYWANSAR